MRVIGDRATFAFEIVSWDKKSGLSDLYMVVDGHRVSDGNPVFWSTFVGYLVSRARLLKSYRGRYCFPPMSHEAAFHILHGIFTSETSSHDFISLADVGCYKLPALDTAIDDWNIYIYDSDDWTAKSIVCRERDDIPDRTTSGEIYGVTVSREDFFRTISELAKAFDQPGVDDKG